MSGGRPVNGYAQGGPVLDANASVADNTVQSCPPGYHWDSSANACVPDAQPQQQASGGVSPMQAISAYNTFGGGSGAAAGSTAPAAGGSDAAATGTGSLAANPYVWLAAAVAATSYGLDKQNVSSFDRQLKGKAIQDIIDSPNFRHHMPKEVSDALGPIADTSALDFKNLPADIWKSAQAPYNYLKKLF